MCVSLLSLLKGCVKGGVLYRGYIEMAENVGITAFRGVLGVGIWEVVWEGLVRVRCVVDMS